MNYAFPQEAIDFLRACRYDPAAVPCCELTSGSLNWPDEHFLAFSELCRSLGCHAAAALFAYRTSLLRGQPRADLQPAWDEVRERCPEWIGFRPERVTPSPELRAYLRRAADEF